MWIEIELEFAAKDTKAPRANLEGIGRPAVNWLPQTNFFFSNRININSNFYYLSSQLSQLDHQHIYDFFFD